MDALIKRFDAVRDNDLMVCVDKGVAWQRDMSIRAKPGINAEGVNYFDHYTAFSGADIGKKLHDGRTDFVDAYAGKVCPVLDVGVGCGDFIRRRPNTFGIDVNPKAIEWLEENGFLGSDIRDYKAFTFWDVLEHIEDPNIYFKRMPEGSLLFTSIPVFEDLTKVRESKHYKPGEHLYYWTREGFVNWMALYRFRMIASSTFESDAGRDGIMTFAFAKDLPDYHATIDQYRLIHSKAYGITAYLYFDLISDQVLRMNPGSILDFGCGRSDMVAHFWKDGARRIAKYDPAIPQYKVMPEGDFDLVLCTDVMEHIPMIDVASVFGEIKKRSRKVIFTISLKPARAKLPDGRNAHVTLLTAAEWLRWIKDTFGEANRIDTGKEHLLMVRTF